MEGELTRVWRRIKKRRGWEDSAGIAADLQESMAKFSPVPPDMADELADYFIGDPVDEQTVYKCEEVLELLSGSWKDQESALNHEDWIFIRDLVNLWAIELDMDIVTAVMQAVVDKGGFHND